MKGPACMQPGSGHAVGHHLGGLHGCQQVGLPLQQGVQPGAFGGAQGAAAEYRPLPAAGRALQVLLCRLWLDLHQGLEPGQWLFAGKGGGEQVGLKGVDQQKYQVLVGAAVLLCRYVRYTEVQCWLTWGRRIMTWMGGELIPDACSLPCSRGRVLCSLENDQDRRAGAARDRINHGLGVSMHALSCQSPFSFALHGRKQDCI